MELQGSKWFGTAFQVHRGNTVAVRPEEQDQGGRKRLRGGISGKKEARDGERGNPEEPDLSVTSNGREQLRGRGGGRGGAANSTVHAVVKWVGCGRQTSGHPHYKNLFIALNHTPS